MYASKAFELVTVENYLAGEKLSEVKHEYVHGKVYAMAGASQGHNRIAINLVTKLSNATEEKGCRIFVSDMKLRANESTFYYPDIMVVCTKAADNYYEDNPCLLVEILSPSTEKIDRREKLDIYMKIPSLQSYLLIDSQKRFITGYYRKGQLWEERTWTLGKGKVEFSCCDVILDLDEIYRGLSFN